MKLIKYELKKLFSSKALAALLAALLLAGAFVCFFSESRTEANISFDEYRNRYVSDVKRVIRRAEQNKTDLTGGGIGYVVRYQEHIIEKYTAVLDSGKLPEAVSGYNEYILFSGNGFIMLLIAAVILGAAVSVYEKDAGMLPFLRLGKRSCPVFASKLTALFALSFALSFINSIFAFAITGIRYGFDGFSAPLTSVQSFEFCPYNISVCGYICVLLCFTALLSFFISSLSALIGRLTESWPVTILCGGAAVCGLYLSGFNFNHYFIRYNAVNIFDNPVGLLTVTALCFTVFLAAVCLVFCLRFIRRTALGQKSQNIEKRFADFISHTYAKLRRQMEKPHRRRQRSLYMYELKKIFLSSGLIFLVVLLLGGKLYFTLISQKYDPYESEYQRLCSELCGELTDEKTALINHTLDACNEIISQRDIMRNNMMQNYITHDEYDAYMQEYYEADIKKSSFARLALQCDHITLMQAAGKSGNIIYDTGWHELFFADMDRWLYALLLFLFAGIYTFEYKCGIGSLVPGIGNGWRKLDRVKCHCAVSITAVLFIIFSAVDILPVCTEHPLTNASFSLCSLIGLSAFPDWLPLSAGLVLLLLGKLVVWILFSLAVCFLSKKLRNLYFVVPVTVLLTLVPYVLIDSLKICL